MRRRIANQFQVDLKQYKKGKRLNRGGFGVVYQVTNKETDKIYAAKVIDCGDNQEECDKMFNREVGILMNVNHPTIIKFIGYSTTDFLEEQNITLIMELATNGSLQDVIKKLENNYGPADYTNTSRQIILIGVARGMKYLHDRNILHRDLKPGNILLDEYFHPLITDFGMSKIAEIGHTYSQTQFGGTLQYMAPEIHRGDRYGPEADVYAFGILMYEVVTDAFAFPELRNGMTDLVFRNKVVNDNYRPKFTMPIKEPIKNLIEKCWSDDPSLRPTFCEIFRSLASGGDFFLDGVDADEVNLYTEDVNEVNDPYERLLARNEELEKRVKELTAENGGLQKRVKDLTAENDELRKQVSSSKKRDADKAEKPPAKISVKQEKPAQPARRSYRDKNADVIFVCDATKSAEQFFHDIKEKSEDAAFEFRISNRRHSFSYASICYREGVEPFYFDFDEEIEHMADFYESIPQAAADLSPSSSFDFSAPLGLAIDELSPRDTRRKVVVWLAAGSARGSRFSGEECISNKSEEAKLESQIKRLAEDGIWFLGVYFNEKAEKTFDEMREIYVKYGGPKFMVFDKDDNCGLFIDDGETRVPDNTYRLLIAEALASE